MILTLLISVVLGVLTMILSIIPSLPPMPQSIVTASEFIITTVAGASGFLALLYGEELFIAIIGAIVALFNFTHIYHFVMWVWRKLPISST